MIRSTIIILTLGIAGSHCQDSSLDKDRLHEQRSLAEDDGKRSDAEGASVIVSDERVTAPQKVAGAYLQCQTQTYDSATDDLSISCAVYRPDQSKADTLGLWEIQLTASAPGESIRALDPEKGLFMYHAANLKAADDLGKRLSVSYRGRIDSLLNAVVRSSDQSVETPLFVPIPPTYTPLVCPSGYSLVAGDKDYGTDSFCLMRYEASNDGFGRPQSKPLEHWGSMPLTLANSTCALLGPQYQLVSNPQWMTVASQIAAFPENWTGKKVGAGMLFTGHTDVSPASTCPPSPSNLNVYVEGNCNPIDTGDSADQNRTHVLANSEIFWDLSGNSYEFVGYVNSEDKPGATVQWYEYTALTGTAITPLSHLIPNSLVKTYWSDTWTSTQGIGQFWPGTNGSGGMLSRGGDFSDGLKGGIFAGSLTQDPADASQVTSAFRCAYHR